jgi:hypothetical protein
MSAKAYILDKWQDMNHGAMQEMKYCCSVCFAEKSSYTRRILLQRDNYFLFGGGGDVIPRSDDGLTLV